LSASGVHAIKLHAGKRAIRRKPYSIIFKPFETNYE
jgi:hypothetical protein